MFSGNSFFMRTRPRPSDCVARCGREPQSGGQLVGRARRETGGFFFCGGFECQKDYASIRTALWNKTDLSWASDEVFLITSESVLQSDATGLMRHPCLMANLFATNSCSVGCTRCAEEDCFAVAHRRQKRNKFAFDIKEPPVQTLL